MQFKAHCFHFHLCFGLNFIILQLFSHILKQLSIDGIIYHKMLCCMLMMCLVVVSLCLVYVEIHSFDHIATPKQPFRFGNTIREVQRKMNNLFFTSFTFYSKKHQRVLHFLFRFRFRCDFSFSIKHFGIWKLQ